MSHQRHACAGAGSVADCAPLDQGSVSIVSVKWARDANLEPGPRLSLGRWFDPNSGSHLWPIAQVMIADHFAFEPRDGALRDVCCRSVPAA
jgi:hypothetical protein